jgi:hypothetical protein
MNRVFIFLCPTLQFSFLFLFSYFKCKSEKRFRHFPTVSNFSTFNSEYPEFKANHYCSDN